MQGSPLTRVRVNLNKGVFERQQRLWILLVASQERLTESPIERANSTLRKVRLEEGAQMVARPLFTIVHL